MATPFRSDAQITLCSVSNPTDSWAVLYSRFAAKSSKSRQDQSTTCRGLGLAKAARLILRTAYHQGFHGPQ